MADNYVRECGHFLKNTFSSYVQAVRLNNTHSHYQFIDIINP